MRVEIDQSGRVEDLSMGTVVAFSNGCQKSIWITAGEKRKITQYLKPDAPLFFSILVFLLIKDEKLTSVIIDEEYTKKDSYIYEKLNSLFYNHHLKPPHVLFGRIGKRSNAHNVAITVHRSKGKGVPKINFQQIAKFLK